MKVDYLVAEIGSTTTLVTAFNTGYDAKGQIVVDIPFQGKSCTTVLDGDVTIGLKECSKRYRKSNTGINYLG